MSNDKLAQLNKRAFTLSEVLITLMVIGVVAALAIPALLTSTNKSENFTALKKAYATLSQAAMQIRQENGGDMVGVASSNTQIMNKFAEKMNTVKKCYNSTDTGDCYLDNTEDTYTLDGGYINNDTPYAHAGAIKFLTNDGVVYIFTNYSSNCSQNFAQKDGQSINCGLVLVDINGRKKPNTLGKDMFYFEINKNSIAARGTVANTLSYNLLGTIQYLPDTMCDTGITHAYNGATCTAKALSENGINYY